MEACLSAETHSESNGRTRTGQLVREDELLISLPCNYAQTSRPQKGRVSRCRTRFKTLQIFIVSSTRGCCFCLLLFLIRSAFVLIHPVGRSIYPVCVSMGNWTSPPNDNRKSDRKANGETNAVKASRQYCFVQ